MCSKCFLCDVVTVRLRCSNLHFRVISATLTRLEVCKIIRYLSNFSMICSSLPFIFRDSVC